MAQEQMEKLWEYQKADMAADSFEKQMKRSPIRLALQKNHDYLLEQQAAIKKIEKDIADMSERVELIKKAIRQIAANAAELKTRMDSEPEDLQGATALHKDLKKLLYDLSDYEKELQNIRESTEAGERQNVEIRTRYAKVKAEYDKQKVEYEAEKKELMAQLGQKRAEAAAKSEGIAPELLERYNAIKKHCTPPVARLYNGQCGGCNMNLPQATLRKFKGDALFVECENCGRLMIQ